MGIPCSPVNNIAEAAADPQVSAREMIVEVEQPGAGVFKTVNSPFKFSRTPGVTGHAPALGEHTAQIFKEWLGMSEKEISRLKQDQVV